MCRVFLFINSYAKGFRDFKFYLFAVTFFLHTSKFSGSIHLIYDNVYNLIILKIQGNWKLRDPNKPQIEK